MNNRASNKILAFTLAAAMLLTLLPGVTVQAADVEIQEGLPSITVGTVGNSTPTVIGFGGHEWVVIGDASSGVYPQTDSVTLLLKNGDVGDGFGTSMFRAYSGGYVGNYTNPHDYDDSTLQTAMDSAYNGLSDSREQALVSQRDFDGGAEYNNYGSDGVAGNAVSDANFWPLSVNEANSLDNSVREYSGGWWLRSPGSDDYTAAVVFYNGIVDAVGNFVNIPYAIRSAFKLNLSSVIFTSAAVGGKSVTVGDVSLSAAQQPTGVVKLTVLDSSMAMPILTFAGTTNGSGELRFDYTGAKTGTKQYVSCVLEASGAVKYYGKLADCEIDGNGTLSIPLTDVDDGTYTLKIFSEQANDNYYTDFCSDPVIMTVTVSSSNGTVSGFTGMVDDAKPTVSSVTPSGNNVATSTSALSVMFSEEMNTAPTMTGTVSLDNGASLSGGVWQSDNKTIQYTLSDLDYNTPYILNISGFKDVAGNVMDTDTGHSFTTTTSSSGSSGGGGVTTYTVTFDSKEGSAVSKYTGVIYGNTIKTPADPTKSGYTFAGWYKDDTTFNTPWDFTTDKVTGNITLYAKWTSDSSSDSSPILNGWVKVGEDYYYYKNDVKVTSTWITTKAGNKYYIGANGKMAKSKWITTKYGNKYYVGANGRMVKSKWITTKYGNKYYVQTNGRMAKSKWITTKYGNKYYVQANGRMAKSKWITTKYGNKYYVDANGRMTKKK